MTICTLSVLTSSTSFSQELKVNGALDPMTGTHDGLFWDTAYVHPQDALDNIANGGAFTEVWVAEGLYLPQGGTLGSTFSVPNGIAVIGGFRPGDLFEESRTGSARATILSGDIGTTNDPSDNCRHVVTIGEGPAETRIESFTIVDGNAQGIFGPNGVGGGILCRNSDLRVNGCYIRDNLADRGAGIYVGREPGGFSGQESSGGVRLHGCIFENNFARKTGGAIHLAEYGVPSLPSPGFTVAEPSWIMDCFFTRNSAGLQSSNDQVIAAQGGGAIYFGDRNQRVLTSPNAGLNMWVYNSRFTNNSVRGRGAACFLSETYENGGVNTFLNCTMAYNFVLQTDSIASSQRGGGTIWVAAMQSYPSNLACNHMINSIVYSTLAAGGGPAAGDAITGPGSNSGQAQVFGAGLYATFSDIEVVLASTPAVYGQNTASNIDLGPLFVDVPGRDLRLQFSSPCRDTGLTSGAPLFTIVPDWPNVDGSASIPANNDPYPSELYRTRLRNVPTSIDMVCHEVQPGE
ncbi:hypothetical protein Poly30_40750 [Planctomycetes bacterium Poly30]|uniref:Right handed beta helix domain-containing protein n=1 Tax=Saltatorellus ferox TaxID=2528018 RepID=A0A518EWS6_9BACT|nr:hypothetical protein Poly30_40750 [Planctomycetes bacterium Poly30]